MTETLRTVYLDHKEAAAYLHVGVRTLADWRYRRTGPPYVKPSSHVVLYARADLDRWLLRNSYSA